MTGFYSEKTALIADRIKGVGIQCSHEFQDTIMFEIKGFEHCDDNDGQCGVVATFGHANKTWGASVDTNCGASLGYIETGLKFEDAKIDVLCQAMLIGLFEYKTTFNERIEGLTHDEIHDIEPIYVEWDTKYGVWRKK